jgi:4-diphosphocytidyl-2-C-methyl-D-erythritol kinase
MRNLTAKSYTRITLALDIIGKIASGPVKGYHELSIIKHQIGLFDTLTIEESSATEIRCDNPLVPRDESNICWKALSAVNTALGLNNRAIITIEKKIPVMGGLAGGSANAAATIRLIDQLWNLGLSNTTMAHIGRTLGMDVPYFFTEATAFDSEATGILESIPTKLHFNFVLVIPDFGVSTKEAYNNIIYPEVQKKLEKTQAMRLALTQNNAAAVIENMHNDFELSVFKQYSELSRIKQRLINLGCDNAAMSGSGSTMVGALGERSDPEKIRKEIGHTTMFVSTK